MIGTNAEKNRTFLARQVGTERHGKPHSGGVYWRQVPQLSQTLNQMITLFLVTFHIKKRAVCCLSPSPAETIFLP